MPYNDYDPKNYNPNLKFTRELIPVGDHRVRIRDCSYYISKNSGKESIKIEFDVSGTKSRLWLYIGCQPETHDAKVRLDQRLGEFMDAFKIPQTMNFGQWLNKVGAVHVKHEDFNGEKSAKIAYILRQDEAARLPAWKEPGDSSRSSQAFASPDVMPYDVSDLNNFTPPPQSYRQNDPVNIPF